MDNIKVVEAYYNAMEAKNIEGMGKYLHSDLHFIGPVAQITGKQAILEAMQKGFLPLLKEITIHHKFSSEDQVMFTYILHCVESLGDLRVAALITVKEGLIHRIELFFDPRAFIMKRDEVLSNR